MAFVRTLTIYGGLMCAITILFRWIVYPQILRSEINAAKHLSPASKMRNHWIAPVSPDVFKIYLFNVTNPMEIKNGAKPKIKEIGPYVYDQYKEKVNLVDNEADDTVQYNVKTTWHFNVVKSNGLTGYEDLFFLHPAILETDLFRSRANPDAIDVAAMAMDSICNNRESIFAKVKARDIMFDGLPVNCGIQNSSDASTMCMLMNKESKNLISIGPNLYKISLFGHKNGTVSAESMKANRGLTNPEEVGRILDWGNQSALSTWSEESCNSYNGTDFTIFHSFLYENENVESFFPEICRSFVGHYQKSTTVKGIETNRYTIDFGNQSKFPEQKCFCSKPDSCLKKGALDLLKCMGTPIVATLPHFYLTDPSYSESVSCLHPVQEKHETFIDLEPLSGTPIRSWKRLQFNMFIFPVKKCNLTKNFPRALLPLAWVEEGVKSDDHMIRQLKDDIDTLTLVKLLTWILLFLSIVLTAFAGKQAYKNHREKMNRQRVAIVVYTAEGVVDYIRYSPTRIPHLEPRPAIIE